ncbi:MAG: hypothetical protein AMXMBFR34_43800 [Myxococcaceae bacterium]
MAHSGQRTQAHVMDVILRHRADLASCAAEARRREPGVTGKLVLRFRIEADGAARSTEVLSLEVQDAYFTVCVREQVMPRMRFDPASGPDDIIFPFKF